MYSVAASIFFSLRKAENDRISRLSDKRHFKPSGIINSHIHTIHARAHLFDRNRFNLIHQQIGLRFIGGNHNLRLVNLCFRPFRVVKTSFIPSIDLQRSIIKLTGKMMCIPISHQHIGTCMRLPTAVCYHPNFATLSQPVPTPLE